MTKGSHFYTFLTLCKRLNLSVTTMIILLLLFLFIQCKAALVCATCELESDLRKILPNADKILDIRSFATNPRLSCKYGDHETVRLPSGEASNHFHLHSKFRGFDVEQFLSIKNIRCVVDDNGQYAACVLFVTRMDMQVNGWLYGVNHVMAFINDLMKQHMFKAYRIRIHYDSMMPKTWEARIARVSFQGDMISYNKTFIKDPRWEYLFKVDYFTPTLMERTMKLLNKLYIKALHGFSDPEDEYRGSYDDGDSHEGNGAKLLELGN